jgi:hypothetical protein
MARIGVSFYKKRRICMTKIRTNDLQGRKGRLYKAFN